MERLVPLRRRKAGWGRVVLALPLTVGVGSLTTVRAQPLQWERVGTIQDVRGIAFDADTLYACSVTGPIHTVKLRPGDPDFIQAFSPGTGCDDLSFTSDGIIYLLSGSLGRTADRGITWAEAVRQAFTLPSRTSTGTLIAGVRGNTDGTGSLAARSTDDGLTWGLRGIAGTQGLGTTSLLVLPPAPARPLGRLVAGGFGGLATSDDDGLTWQPTALYGPFLHNAWSTTTVAAGEHAGRHLAVIDSGGVPNGIYSSTDGLTWTFLAPLPTQVPFETRLTAAPDGALYAYESGGDGPPAGAFGRPVWSSLDGGATWADVGRVWTAWSTTPTQIEVGPDGRLYASGRGAWTGSQNPLGGVFRTVERVVATLPSVPATSGLAVRVSPNPASRRVTVSVERASAGRVYVELVDAVGRVIWQGEARNGRVEFDVAGWASGVYSVRATADGATVSASVTVR